MKRATGVITIVAIFVALRGFSSCISLLVPKLAKIGEWVTSEQEARVDVALKYAVEHSYPKNEMARWEQLKQKFSKRREFYGLWTEDAHRSPLSYFVWLTLSVMELVAGIGMLFWRDWGRRLLLWDAGLSMCNVLQLYGRLWASLVFDPNIEQQHSHVWQGFSLSVIAWSLIINGFLIWFFTRPSVKAQFQRNEGAQA